MNGKQESMTSKNVDPKAIARACHEANRAWCIAQGDLTQVSWDETPEAQRLNMLAVVRELLDGAGIAPAETPEQRAKDAIFQGVVNLFAEAFAYVGDSEIG